MGFKCGIVGLPNVGKSTIFNALTQAGVAAENYPFCTIEPNVGVVSVPDERLYKLATIADSVKIIPATMEFVDIAGLVAGASQGEGLGNQFLSHIRESDAIGHVVRCFEDSDVAHVSGQARPENDIEVINTELMLADLATAENALRKATKSESGGIKRNLAEYSALLKKVIAHLDAGKPVRSLSMNDDEKKSLKSSNLITAKPIMYIANVAEDGFEHNPYVEQVRAIAATEDAGVVTICATIEAEIALLEEAEKQEFLQDIGVREAGLNRVILAGYNLLGLQTFFTAGPKEARAWTIKKGSLAPQGAGKIHTDFEKGFIRAEVISYQDYIDGNGEAGAKEAGKWRLEGKEYVILEGDVIHFRFNV